jgi:hypothetical protein
MSTNINNPVYSTLNTYALLAYSGITTVNKTSISNGFYGTPAGTGITGTYSGTRDDANATTAQTELTNLVSNINIRTFELTSYPLATETVSITLYPNRNYNGEAITFEGISITLDAQGDPNAQFFITSSSSIKFNNVSSITLINRASNFNIFWLAGSLISFTGTNPPSIQGIFIAGSAITFDNASQTLGRLYAQTENVTFLGTSSVNGECFIVCYAKGTLILTKKGLMPIEKIKAGHKVVTKGKIYKSKYIKRDANLELEPVIWISKFKVINLNSKSRPICIKKDALKKNYPFQDLYVSPGHRLLLNGKMILAKNIVNGKSIYQDNDCDSVEYYHLECENHSAIFANGILSESYLDINNRNVFENSIRLRRKTDPKKEVP